MQGVPDLPDRLIYFFLKTIGRIKDARPAARKEGQPADSA